MSPETLADLRSLCLVYMQVQGKMRPLMQVRHGSVSNMTCICILTLKSYITFGNYYRTKRQQSLSK